MDKYRGREGGEEEEEAPGSSRSPMMLGGGPQHYPGPPTHKLISQKVFIKVLCKRQFLQSSGGRRVLMGEVSLYQHTRSLGVSNSRVIHTLRECRVIGASSRSPGARSPTSSRSFSTLESDRDGRRERKRERET